LISIREDVSRLKKEGSNRKERKERRKGGGRYDLP
jgi:hypothetical protein